MASSAFHGQRVAIVAGPRAGLCGTVQRARSSRQFDVLLDEGGVVTVVRHGVERIGAPPTRPPRAECRGRYGSVADRVQRLFRIDPSLERVVVWRTDSGRTWVAPWFGQEVGGALIGVYSRQVTLDQVTEDARA